MDILRILHVTNFPILLTIQKMAMTCQVVSIVCRIKTSRKTTQEDIGLNKIY